MPVPDYSVADFTAAMQALFPRGPVWPRDPGATLTAVVAGLAATYQQQTARSAQLLVDAFPATTVELLPEWQSTLGLPDPAGPGPVSTAAAQAQVAAKFAASGGQSAAAFIAAAAAAGVAITVQSHAPFRAGQSKAGQQLGTTDWFYAWTITGPTAALGAITGLLAEAAPAQSTLLYQLT